MSPWDELNWFELIKETNLGSTTDTTNPSVPANAQRVWIVFAVGPNGQSANVSTLPNPGASSGFTVTAAQPLFISHKDYPGLPQKAWFIRSVAPAVLNMWQGPMRDWPPDAEDGAEPIVEGPEYAQGQDKI